MLYWSLRVMSNPNNCPTKTFQTYCVPSYPNYAISACVGKNNIMVINSRSHPLSLD